jgi:Xaa-Pro aminopeptidase
MAVLDADVLVATDPSTVAWLTGFTPDATSGPSPFAAVAAAVVRDGTVTLVCSADEEAAVDPRRARVVAYEGFTIGMLDPGGGALAALAGLDVRGRVAVEAHALPASYAAALGGPTCDVADRLRALRSVKTTAELEAIRRAIRICDAGQYAARQAIAPGRTELEAWSDVQAAMEVAAGERLPLLADFVSGPRTAEVGGPPTGRVMEEGELVICDLVPRVGGLWGDSCATLAVGRPPAAAVAAHARAVETLDRLIAAIRPGILAGELDAIGRAAGLTYPHHTGHGLGYAYHEQPRIVPGDPTVLEPGMVIALEPGTYPGPWGLRVERICVVTDDGCEVLSRHEVTL